MKPINEKERTTAFIQFTILNVLLIILIVIFVFADFKTFKKEREVFRSENQKLNDGQSFNNNFSSSIDSLVNIVKLMENMGESDYSSNSLNIRYLFDMWKKNIQPGDTTNADRIKLSISNSIINWMNDKKLIMNYNELLQEKSILKRDKETIERDAKANKEKADEYYAKLVKCGCP